MDSGFNLLLFADVGDCDDICEQRCCRGTCIGDTDCDCCCNRCSAQDYTFTGSKESIIITTIIVKHTFLRIFLAARS